MLQQQNTLETHSTAARVCELVAKGHPRARHKPLQTVVEQQHGLQLGPGVGARAAPLCRQRARDVVVGERQQPDAYKGTSLAPIGGEGPVQAEVGKRSVVVDDLAW